MIFSLICLITASERAKDGFHMDETGNLECGVFILLGSMKRTTRELAENKIDLAKVQDWTSGGSDFFYDKGNKNHHLGTIFFFLYIRQLHLYL
jgi:hypothetical protein